MEWGLLAVVATAILVQLAVVATAILVQLAVVATAILVHRLLSWWDKLIGKR